MSLLTIEQVRERLGALFPGDFPDRAILVGIMAARVVFVGLYGKFIEGKERYLRPSTIIKFTPEQAALNSDAQREAWAATCHKMKHVNPGTPWYKENSREPVRDDLIRNKLLPMGIMLKLPGYAVTHPAPIYSLAAEFAALFDPALTGAALETAMDAWRKKHLDPGALRRMALRAAAGLAKAGDVDIKLPETGQVLRITGGTAAIITKDVVEVLAPMMFKQPLVVHLSASDKKVFPELVAAAKSIGLAFDPKAELPDVVIADIGREKLHLGFIEVVHSDGAMNELRAKTFLKVAEGADTPPERVLLATAFDDREASSFRDNFSELAVGSFVWFRTEPEMVMHLVPMAPRS